MQDNHKSVLLKESIFYLSPKKGGIYVDATIGSGGHAEEILKVGGKVIGIDQDEDALRRTKTRLGRYGDSLQLVRNNFSKMDKIVVQGADGVIFDLGVSTDQLKDPDRGFGFDSGSLDMRMDKGSQLTAKEIVSRWSKNKLAEIIWKYGEEGRSRKIADVIKQARDKEEIKTARQLADLIANRVKGGRIHPATKTFQALRIAVNDELEILKDGIEAALKILNKNGMIVVISFHSLEDRIVKHSLLDNARKGRVRILTKKPVTPTQAEIKENKKSRSAKLRAAQKIVAHRG